MQSAWRDAAGHHSLSTFSVEFPPYSLVAVSGFAHFVSMTHVAGTSRRLTPPADLNGHDHVPVADERPIFRVTAMRVQLTSLALGYTLNTAAGREGVPLYVPVADRLPTAGGPRHHGTPPPEICTASLHSTCRTPLPIPPRCPGMPHLSQECSLRCCVSLSPHVLVPRE